MTKSNELSTAEINSYSQAFTDLQCTQAEHKVTATFKEKTGLKVVPAIMTRDLIKELEFKVREGVDKVKFDLLLQASMRENSLSKKERDALVASMRRAFDFVMNRQEQLVAKAP